MLNTYPALSTRTRDIDGNRICYGITVVCVSLLVFCVLIAAISVVKACAITGGIMAFFAIIGCFAPTRGAGGSGARASAGRATTTAGPPPLRCTCRLVKAATNALPAFEYESPARSDGKPGSCVLCSVCLEAIQGGVMVRQLPVCKHLFHIDCIDTWLHSHPTCPLCRCQLVLPKVTAKAAAPTPPSASAAVAAESTAETLPPV